MNKLAITVFAIFMTVNRSAIIKAQLQEVMPYLAQKYHVASLGLFGSVTREDFTPASDIDIVVDFSRPIGIEFVDLADELERLLRRKVDLVSRQGIKSKYFQAIQADIQYV